MKLRVIWIASLVVGVTDVVISLAAPVPRSIVNIGGFQAVYHPELSLGNSESEITQNWRFIRSKDTSSHPKVNNSMVVFKDTAPANGSIWSIGTISASIKYWRIEIRFRDVCNDGCDGFAFFMVHNLTVYYKDKQFENYGLENPLSGLGVRVIPKREVFAGWFNNSNTANKWKPSSGSNGIKTVGKCNYPYDLTAMGKDAVMVIQAADEHLSIHFIPEDNTSLAWGCLYARSYFEILLPLIHTGNLVLGVTSVSLSRASPLNETVELRELNFFELKPDPYYRDAATARGPQFPLQKKPSDYVLINMPQYSLSNVDSFNNKWISVGHVTVTPQKDKIQLKQSQGADKDAVMLWAKSRTGYKNAFQIEVQYEIKCGPSGDCPGFVVNIRDNVHASYRKVQDYSYSGSFSLRMGFTILLDPNNKTLSGFFYPKESSFTYRGKNLTKDNELPFFIGEAKIESEIKKGTLVIQSYNNIVRACILSTASSQPCQQFVSQKLGNWFESLRRRYFFGVAAKSFSDFVGDKQEISISSIKFFILKPIDTGYCSNWPYVTTNPASRDLYIPSTNGAFNTSLLVYCPFNSVVSGTTEQYTTQRCVDVNGAAMTSPSVICEPSKNCSCFNGGQCDVDVSLGSNSCFCPGTYQPPDCLFDSATLPTGAVAFYPFSRKGFYANLSSSLNNRLFAYDQSGSSYNLLAIIENNVYGKKFELPPFNCTNCSDENLATSTSKDNLGKIVINNANKVTTDVFSIAGYFLARGNSSTRHNYLHSFFTWGDEYESFIMVSINGKTDSIEVRSYDSSLGQKGTVLSTCSMPYLNNVWYLFSASFDPTTRDVTVRRYQGSKSCFFSGSLTKHTFPSGKDQKFIIGYNYMWYFWTTGRINMFAFKCVGIYNRALSAEDLQQYSNACVVAHQFFIEETTTTSTTTTAISTTIPSSSGSTVDTYQPASSETLATAFKQVTEIPMNEIPNLDTVTPQAIPTVQPEQLVEACVDISPLRRSPPTLKPGEKLGVIVRFTVDRFVGIDDIEQKLALSGVMFIQWIVQTCNSDTTAPSLTAPERLVVRNVNQVWRPAIDFVSAVDDLSLTNSLIYDRMEILIDNSIPMRTMFFYWKRHHIWQTVCQLDLSSFPFDVQTCQYRFNLDEAMHLIQFVKTDLRRSSAVSELKETGWQYVDSTSFIDVGTSYYGGTADNVSQAVFQFTLKRHPRFFIINIILPWISLIGLLLVAFAMPSISAGRLCVSVNLFLGLIFGMAGFQIYTPSTPQNVLMTDYVGLLVILAAVANIILLSQFFFAFMLPEKAQKKISICGITTVQLCTLTNTIGFTIFFISLIAVHCYAFGFRKSI